MSDTFCYRFTHFTPVIPYWQISMLARFFLLFCCTYGVYTSVAKLAQTSSAKNSAFEQGENEWHIKAKTNVKYCQIISDCSSPFRQPTLQKVKKKCSKQTIHFAGLIINWPVERINFPHNPPIYP